MIGESSTGRRHPGGPGPACRIAFRLPLSAHLESGQPSAGPSGRRRAGPGRSGERPAMPACGRPAVCTGICWLATSLANAVGANLLTGRSSKRSGHGSGDNLSHQLVSPGNWVCPIARPVAGERGDDQTRANFTDFPALCHRSTLHGTNQVAPADQRCQFEHRPRQRSHHVLRSTSRCTSGRVLRQN